MTQRLFYAVVGDKGGLAKSLFAACLHEHLCLGSPDPWTMVDVEDRAIFSDEEYLRPEGTRFFRLTLLQHDAASNRDNPSLGPLDELLTLIPEDPRQAQRVVLDMGSNMFGKFLLWGLQHRGLQPLRKAGFNFVFFVMIQAGDAGCTGFFNENTPTLLKLGRVVLVRNYRNGGDFAGLDPELVAKVPVIDLLYFGSPVINELQQPERRLTFAQLAKHEQASRRARLDAESCAEHLAEQLTKLQSVLGH